MEEDQSFNADTGKTEWQVRDNDAIFFLILRDLLSLRVSFLGLSF